MKADGCFLFGRSNETEAEKKVLDNNDDVYLYSLRGSIHSHIKIQEKQISKSFYLIHNFSFSF